MAGLTMGLAMATGILGLLLDPLVPGAGAARGQEGSRAPSSEHLMRSRGGEDAEDKGDESEEHGPAEGWRFALPKAGDPAKGRAVFVKLECFSCHQVKGESFPPPTPGNAVGPELSAMVGHHPPEFFAESIINPGAVIDPGRGYEGPDGSSRMPSFNEDLTVQELLDLVAYLMSLKPPSAGGTAPAGPPAGRPGH